jgi:hypothetical protein
LTQKHPTLGAIFALIAAILFGLNASTTKVIIEAGINAEQVVFIHLVGRWLQTVKSSL